MSTNLPKTKLKVRSSRLGDLPRRLLPATEIKLEAARLLLEEEVQIFQPSSSFKIFTFSQISRMSRSYASFFQIFPAK